MKYYIKTMKIKTQNKIITKLKWQLIIDEQNEHINIIIIIWNDNEYMKK